MGWTLYEDALKMNIFHRKLLALREFVDQPDKTETL